MSRALAGRGASALRIAGLALALILGVCAFETAVHSVHHLGDPDRGVSCQVLSASHHLPGLVAGPPDLGAPAARIEPAPVADPARVLPARFSRPDEGRAPPSIPSA